MTHKKNSQNSWVGFILILLGALFLLDNIMDFDLFGLIGDWWPVALIIIGLMKLQAQDRGAGLIFILLGILFLLMTNDIVKWDSIWKLWPLVLIIIGLSMIFKGRRSKWNLTNESTLKNDFIHSNAVFGGAEHAITSQNFKGGETMALFGGVELDLREANISEEGCKINTTALFGSVEMIVPDDWNVIVSGTPIFGGIENKSRGKTDGAGNKEIYLHCTVLFGSIEIK